MNIRKAVFYGDSNTYGFDPRDFSGGRYHVKNIWTSRLAEALEGRWNVINEGMNGRRIPFAHKLLDSLKEQYSILDPEDTFAVMLGTNDILMAIHPDAERPIRHMEKMLGWLTGTPNWPGILIIAPPYIGAEDHPDPLMRRFYEESLRMNEGFEKLAREYGVLFTDSGKWNLPMAYDGIHLSEEGHCIFAEHMILFFDTSM